MGTTYPPDGIDISQGTWGTDVDYETSSSSVSGDGYIEFKNTTPAANPRVRYSGFIPVEAGAPYSFHAWLYASAIGASDTMALRIPWYDNTKSFISTSTVFGLSALDAATTWERHGGIANAPATAKYARVFAEKNNNGGWTARVDSMNFKAMPYAFAAFRDSDQSVNNPSDIIECNDELYDYGDWYDDTTNYHATVPKDGIYTFMGQAQIELLDADEYFSLYLYESTRLSDYVALGTKVHSPAANQDIRATVVVTKYFQKGDTVQLGAFNGHGSALNVSGESTSQITWFSGQLVE